MPPDPSSTSRAFSRRRALMLGGGALLGAVAGTSGVTLPAHARVAARGLARAFDAAAAKHGVPRDLLVAIGYAETRLNNYDEPSRTNGFGIMHLVKNSAHETLPEAAELTGRSESALKAEAGVNIDGAAAVLREYADDAGMSSGDRSDLGAWYPVVARYSGADESSVMRLYADAVYDALWTGVDKRGVVVDPTPVEPDRSGVASGPRILSSAVDYPGARWDSAHSSNYTSSNRPGSYPINYVVIHVMQGTYAGSISWFKNSSSNVSAHYCIRSSDGQITQMVRHSDIAWHAGNSYYNQRGIGIEHEGWFDEPEWYTEEMYRSSAALTRYICDQYGIPKTRDYIVGHNEVSSTPCPGQIWDWNKYIRYVNEDDEGEVVWDVVVDATSPDFSAGDSWDFSSWSDQKYGDEYGFNTPEPVSDPAWYSADLPQAGTYRIEAWYPANSGYNDRTPYVVAASGGNQSVHVNQRTGGGQWHRLGTFSFDGGYQQVVGVSRWTSGEGYVIADAVRISRLE
ncbi:amidase [Actinobacteria bacterium YIM 96077]|uniref:N-acetylmuramoyl-L-alanine amidase n=1 Tax=Phytoactinopolyspora halophila TaxID=1981511 RepID=A0A329QAF9_9ACTN|nr:N-acetylmuramoyl-L-alanine amidase [Phytoactinopolyspora halophila]AYY12900.1 amidase [Actinobacteria bacterium YIM 96077]RAW09304.1 amidase [Phytoactinopolyspora halophila]